MLKTRGVTIWIRLMKSWIAYHFSTDTTMRPGNTETGWGTNSRSSIVQTRPSCGDICIATSDDWGKGRLEQNGVPPIFLRIFLSRKLSHRRWNRSILSTEWQRNTPILLKWLTQQTMWKEYLIAEKSHPSSVWKGGTQSIILWLY